MQFQELNRPEASSSEINLVAQMPTAPMDFSFSNMTAHNVNMVDSEPDGKLQLWSYNECNNDSPAFVKQCRGLVFSNYGTIVMKSFPYIDEYTHKDVEKISERLGSGKWTFTPSYEGTLLRMFFYDGKWYLSTHRKLDAFKSRWASKDSFGTLFAQALASELGVRTNVSYPVETVMETFHSYLDTDTQYMFLLRTNEQTRIVSLPPQLDHAQLLLVGTVCNGVMKHGEHNFIIPSKDDSMLNKALYTILNTLDFTSESFARDVCNIVSSMHPKYYQGLIGFSETGDMIRIVNEEYLNLTKVRGNEPSINFRYLQLRNDSLMARQLFTLYPDHVPEFQDYENILYEIGKTIFKAYISRFVKKQFVTLPQEEFHVMSQCHTWHQANRDVNKISLQKVCEILYTQWPNKLNHMIRRYKTEKMV